MVLGLRSKNRKGKSVQGDYIIHIQEIKPWPPFQRLKSAESLLLQWENGDQSSGSFTSNARDGKIEFSESFRLPVILYRESSRKSTARDIFQKNYLEFSLYEPRKDRAMKGQLLGSAVINLADHGIIKDNVTISTPINLKKSSKSASQPVLYVNIQPFEGDKSGLSKEVSLDKDGSESVSEVTNEGNDEETEIASFTDDDIDDNVSLHSSRTVSSSALESSRGSPGQDEKNLPGSTNGDMRRAIGEPTLGSALASLNPEVSSTAEGSKDPNRSSYPPSSIGLSSDLQNPRNDHNAEVMASDDNSQAKNSNYVYLEVSEADKDANKKGWKDDIRGQEAAATSNLLVGHMEDKLKKQDKEQNEEFMVDKKAKQSVDDLPRETEGRQFKLRSNTLVGNRTANGAQGNTRKDKLKHLKSVQLQNDVTESYEPISNVQFMMKAKKIDITENVQKVGPSNVPNERQKTRKDDCENKVLLKSEVEVPGKEFNGAAAGEVGHYSAASKHGKSANEVQHVETANEAASKQGKSANEVQHVETANEVCASCARCEKEQIQSSNFGNNVELESKVEMLEEELMEAAVVEVGLYSVVAEHGSSTNKVHAPARRLSRFYLHACKGRLQAKRASAARTIISGLVLVSKACGNDVPRLTFWLSNSIVLRAIVTQVVEKLQLAAAPSNNKNVEQNGKHESSPYKDSKTSRTNSDEWEEPQTFIMALERVESWIFSRIVESVWWQTLTPHMQSTVVKGSSSKKIHARRYGLGDQEQGNFAIDLWKKAFSDACERLCPVRACGHECGCLGVLSRLVMEQLVHRLDVAMFNAILRESAEEMPTDPVSDPISDPKVLPIPPGKASFGAGAQLKNAVGNWSRWLTDLFGIDDNDSQEDKSELDCNSTECETSFKVFHLLNALSDLMMLPFEMLADRSTRKEVCPTFGAQIIERVLNGFVPDEFNPDPIPDAIFEFLDSEALSEDGKECITSFPCTAAPTIYTPPSTASLKNIVGQVENQSLQRSGPAVLRKSYTSDDELDELDSPLSSIIVDNSRASSTSTTPNWMPRGNGGRKVVRYQLLRQVWRDS